MEINDLELFLKKIRSVISVKIVYDDDTEQIEELHVLADSTRNTKQIARDIRSVLIANFAIDIDYKVISIAQIDQGIKLNPNFRLLYNGYTNENSTDYIKITVTLSWGDVEYVGTSVGKNTEKNRLKVACNATLDAVKSAIGMDCFMLEDIQIGRMSDYEIMFVGVSLIEENREALLIGSATVKTNKIEGTIKATLDALNRKLSLFFN